MSSKDDVLSTIWLMLARVQWTESTAGVYSTAQIWLIHVSCQNQSEPKLWSTSRIIHPKQVEPVGSWVGQAINNIFDVCIDDVYKNKTDIQNNIFKNKNLWLRNKLRLSDWIGLEISPCRCTYCIVFWNITRRSIRILKNLDRSIKIAEQEKNRPGITIHSGR